MYKKILVNGVWRQNPAATQLLGLCPLLAVSNTTVNSMGLSIATILVLIFSNSLTSIFRNLIPNQIRIPIFVLIISSSVTVIILVMQAFFINLYNSLGIFVSLIVTNCLIIGRAESFATKNKLSHSMFDGLAMGLGLSFIIVLLGMIRESLSHGTIFFGLDKIFGPSAADLYINLINTENHLLLAGLPAGAFICFGFLLAGLNWINIKVDQIKIAKSSQTATVKQL